MEIIQKVFDVLFFVTLIPSHLLIPAIIITAIIGAVKKDYSYLKKCLKIWGYSFLVMFGVMILYAVFYFIRIMFR